MNKQSLKKKAEALEDAFAKYQFLSDDIKELSTYEPLVIAIAGAKNETINEPGQIQLGYWLFETYIQSYPDFVEALADFCLEFRGIDIK